MLKKLFLSVCLIVFFALQIFALNDLSGIVIAIDPGHGGDQPGAVGPTGLKEANAVLEISKKLRDKLTARGAKVEMTRSSDVTLSLTARTNFANAVKADRLISIHLNAFNGQSNYTLMCVYTSATPTSAGTQISKFIAADINTEIGLSFAYSNFSPQIPGVRKENFHMVRESNMPALLTESSFIDFPIEETKLKNPAYLEQVATIIFAGFCKHYGIETVTQPVTPTPTPTPTPAPEPSTNLSGTSKLTITAKNKFGNLELLENAKVTVIYKDGAKLEKLTASNGKAIFEKIKTEPVEALITKDGFFGVIKNIPLAANASKSSTVNLTPKLNHTESGSQNFGSLTGIITDAVDNKKLQNAKCYLLYNGQIVDMVFSTATGVYNFKDLPVGVYTVHVNAVGYAPEAQSAKVTEGLQKWNSMKLQRMLVQYASISGNVIDVSTGAALANSTLSLYKGTTLAEVKLSDANGKYAFTNLTPYSYKIVCKAQAPDRKYSSKTKSGLNVAAAQNLLYSFEMTSTTMTGSISGYVFKMVSSKKTAVMSTNVGIYRNGALVRTVKSGWGAAAGMFSVRDLKPGTYDIVVNGITKTVKIYGGKVTSTTIQIN